MTPTPVGPAHPPGAPQIPWREWNVGMRVSVRRTLPEGGFADALGYITQLTDEGLEIETRKGKVWVAAEAIYLGKPVPPPPPPRSRRR